MKRDPLMVAGGLLGMALDPSNATSRALYVDEARYNLRQAKGSEVASKALEQIDKYESLMTRLEEQQEHTDAQIGLTAKHRSRLYRHQRRGFRRALGYLRGAYDALMPVS